MKKEVDDKEFEVKELREKVSDLRDEVDYNAEILKDFKDIDVDDIVKAAE